MKVGIIGAGRVGTAFALALAACGEEISGVFSRSGSSVDFISGRLGKVFENNLNSVIRNSKVLLLAVSDSSIAEVAENICSICPNTISGKTFFHCSGALGSDELIALSGSGGYTGSLHPIQSFATREDGWKGMQGIAFGYEGMPEARDKASILVKALKGTLLDIKTETKPLYHTAACILSNYTVTLSYITELLLEASGAASDTGIQAFMPLLRNTVENIASTGSIKALTGPISRGDTTTVDGHLKALKSYNNDIFDLYAYIGRITVKMAVEKGTIDNDKAKRMLDMLTVK